MPHRYPFLLVDRVIEVEPGRRIVAAKNVTMNEPYFVGHFPGDPILPGVMIVEAMAQACALLVASGMEVELRAGAKKTFYLAGLDGFRFRRPVRPGEVLTLEAHVLKHRGPIWKFSVTARVGDEPVAEGEILAALGEASRGGGGAD